MQVFNRAMAGVATVALLATLCLARTTLAQEKGKPEEQAKPKADEAKPKVDAAKSEKPKAEITLSVGDAAPAMKVEKFIKGAPVKKFKPGQIYVVEFWATWCGPCKAVMPHLTELQKKFKDKVTFIGVDIAERGYDDETLKKVEDFVKKNDERMGYTVAYDGEKKEMDNAYMKAAGQAGIPSSFVITGEAKVAYIGHPDDKLFEETIQQLADGKFDMKTAVAAAKERQAKEEAMMRDREKAAKIVGEAMQLIEDEKLDEGLAKLDEIAKLNADFAPMVEMQKFNILMEHEKYDRAYEVAKKLIDGSAGEDANVLNEIAWTIVDPEADVSKRDANVALKAAEKAAKLTEGKNAAILDTLARCYWEKGEKSKAIETQTKAVELAKKDESIPDEVKEGIQAALDEYKQGAKEEKKGSKPKAKEEKKGGEKEDSEDED